MTPRPQHPAPRRTRFAARWLASACLLALAGCALTPPEPEIAPRPGWQPPPVTFWRWGPPPPAPDRDVPPSYMVLLPNADGSTGQVHMQGSQGRQVLDRARQGVDIAGPTTPFAVTEAQIQRDFGAALAARPTLPERFHVYFDSGKADTPTATSQDTLRSVVARAEQTLRAFRRACQAAGRTRTRAPGRLRSTPRSTDDDTP